ncbi:MAG: TolC family protein [Thermodesulfobacteriota bacterium]|nr:TolC family protein [Thermodesulfobacteriota bacterium]
MTSRVSIIWLPTVWLFLFVAAVTMPSAVALAEETQGDPAMLSLEQSIDMALERNLDIQVAREEVLAAEERKKETTTAFLPSLKAEYSYRRPSEIPYAVFDGNKIDFADQDQYRFTGTVEQPLFTGFANLSNYQLAKLGLDVAKIQLTRARFDLILQVKEAYFEILTAGRIKAVAEQSVEQLQAELKTARNFYDVGMSPKIDVLDAEVRLAQAEQQLIRTQNALRIAKASFNTILRRSIDLEVEVEDILSYKPYDKSYESCLEVSLKNRPELMEAEKNVASAEKEITLARSAYYPYVGLSSNYYRAGDEPGVDGSEFEDRENWDIMAVASVTFFEWGKTRFAANQKRARLRQAEEALEQIKDAVRLDVKTSYLNLQAAEENISVAKKGVGSAEENFRISKERYREQVATATEVLDAQTRLTEAKTNYTRALAEFNVAKARLIRAMGVEDES